MNCVVCRTGFIKSLPNFTKFHPFDATRYHKNTFMHIHNELWVWKKYNKSIKTQCISIMKMAIWGPGFVQAWSFVPSSFPQSIYVILQPTNLCTLALFRSFLQCIFIGCFLINLMRSRLCASPRILPMTQHADNIKNDGKFLPLFTDHRWRWKCCPSTRTGGGNSHSPSEAVLQEYLQFSYEYFLLVLLFVGLLL
jgi:hypothetical protein